jgi:transposase InsO family protein
MSRKGNCWDNAVAESFFSSWKKERIQKQIYRDRAMAQTAPRSLSTKLWELQLSSSAPTFSSNLVQVHSTSDPIRIRDCVFH